MKNDIDQRMQELTRTVMNEARTDAEKIKHEATEKAAAILQDAKDKAEQEHTQSITLARKEADSINNQQISSTKLKAQMNWIERREKLLENVFSTARDRMTTITQWTNYEEILTQLIQEALQSIPSQQVRIHADAVSQALLAKGLLEKISKDSQVDLVFGEFLSQGSGIIAESMDGHRQFDNTLEARLDRLQDTLRSPVYHILMGEKV